MDDVHPLRAEGILQPAGVVKLSREDGLYRGRGGDYRAIDQARDKRRPIVVVEVGQRRAVDRDHG